MNSQYLQKARLPDTPGIYFFLNGKKKILYIGKATSLRSRVRSYFAKDIAEVRSPLIGQMVDEAVSIDHRKTDSVLEALILEADLIKKFQPKYNSAEKDDKSFNCVVITKEDFPRVLVVRKKEIDFSQLETTNYKLQIIFGPFPNGGQLRDVLKIVRRIFPYRDMCSPPAHQIPPLKKEVSHSDVTEDFEIPPHSKTRVLPFIKGELQARGKPCFNRQIGLCPGVCTGEITRQEYARTIKNIKLFFSGKKTQIIKNLKREMGALAKVREFENADKIKKTIFALQHIQDVSLIKTDNYKLATNNFRVEAYDIAHLSGTNSVGVMTVIEDGVPKKSDYRKFKINGGFGNNDVASLKEVVERRLKHSEWPFPSLIVADGGIAQKNAIEEVLNNMNNTIPVVAVTKNDKHKPEKIMGDNEVIEKHEREILLSNSEAHRFALAFHRKRRGFGIVM